MKFIVVLIVVFLNIASPQMQDSEVEDGDSWYTIEGKVYSPEALENDNNWQEETQIQLNSGNSI